jgi:hypothetical protein
MSLSSPRRSPTYKLMLVRALFSRMYRFHPTELRLDKPSTQASMGLCPMDTSPPTEVRLDRPSRLARVSLYSIGKGCC